MKSCYNNILIVLQVVHQVQFYCEGLGIPMVGLLGLLGNVAAIIVLRWVLGVMWPSWKKLQSGQCRYLNYITNSLFHHKSLKELWQAHFPTRRKPQKVCGKFEQYELLFFWRQSFSVLGKKWWYSSLSSKVNEGENIYKIRSLYLLLIELRFHSNWLQK